MIQLQNMTPEVYYKQSRDFQLLGRLFDVVLNAVKTNTEVLTNVPFSQNTDERLMDLLALTLGFQSKHNYNSKQLLALCSCFSDVIRNKGSITAINTAVNTLLRAEGITDDALCLMDNSTCVLDLLIPNELANITLLYDLLDYIIPAGISCNIYRISYKTDSGATNLGPTDSSKLIKSDTTGYKSLAEMSIIPQPDILGVRNSYTGTTTNEVGYFGNIIIPKIETKKENN